MVSDEEGVPYRVAGQEYKRIFCPTRLQNAAAQRRLWANKFAKGVTRGTKSLWLQDLGEILL